MKRQRKDKYGAGDQLTRHELAERLRLSTATIDKWTKAGRIPAITHPLGAGHGRPVYFDWQEVAAALKIPS